MVSQSSMMKKREDATKRAMVFIQTTMVIMLNDFVEQAMNVGIMISVEAQFDLRLAGFSKAKNTD